MWPEDGELLLGVEWDTGLLLLLWLLLVIGIVLLISDALLLLALTAVGFTTAWNTTVKKINWIAFVFWYKFKINTVMSLYNKTNYNI